MKSYGEIVQIVKIPLFRHKGIKKYEKGCVNKTYSLSFQNTSNYYDMGIKNGINVFGVCALLFLMQKGLIAQHYVRTDEYKTIGQSNCTYVYEMKVVNDTCKRKLPEEHDDIVRLFKNVVDKDVLVLQIGEEISRSYSYHLYQFDSICTSWQNKGKDVRPGAPLDFAFAVDVYKNHREQKLIVLQRSPMEGPIFKYEEEMLLMEWHILPDRQECIGYSCQKATCHYRGRDWTAWFTYEIPFSEGPWKFHGLPGLILEIEDSTKSYSFVCQGIKQQPESIVIMEDRHIMQSTYEKATEFVRSFYEDIFSYKYKIYPKTRIYQPVPTITTRDANGNIIEKRIPDGKKLRQRYNPIELE